MKEIIPLINKLYKDIVCNGLDDYILYVKDILFVINEIIKTERIKNLSYIKILEFLNLLSVYNINDREILSMMLDIRLLLIERKQVEDNASQDGFLENPYSKKMSRILVKMNLI